ncbi:MAG TPA: sulfatase-like hydrolase/transferase [Planctomycetaceae bacterium]|nr:sulfatase-like hydrolase/transferase [Planctomycetaceae bacterium]
MRAGWCVIAAVLAFGAGVVSAAEVKRPNVLWICADDFAAYAYGAAGNARVRTPHLDRLAASGMRFDRAYCNSPVCTASRQSFLTGRYPRSVGVTLLQSALPDSEITLAEMLHDAGYDTASIGKMHFNSPRSHGFDLRVDMGDHLKWLRRRGDTRIDPAIAVLPVWKPFQDPARIWLNSFCRPVGSIDAEMPGTWFANEAARYLGERGERPFFLMVSFYEPHSPFRFPIEYAGRHKPEVFPIIKPGPEDDWQIPQIFRDLTDGEKQGIAAAYYTSVEYVDKNIGRVLDALEQSGQAENTLVIFTGDHGYMLGEHGRFEKHCCFEPAIRAPLIVRLPGRIAAGQSTQALTEFIDIVPTVTELCGATTPAAVQGGSLVPLLTGKTQKHRDAVLLEYSENEEGAIRTEKWKFIYGTGRRARQDGYATGRPLPGRTVQLYDLEHDPDELTNLADRPERAELVAEFTRQLADHMRRTARQPELVPQTDDVHKILEYCLAPHDVETPR